MEYLNNKIFCEYGCGNEAKYQLKNGKWCCSKSHNSCPIQKEKNKNSNKGRKVPKEVGRKISKSKTGVKRGVLSKKHIEKLSLNLEKIKIKYPLMYKIEEFRINKRTNKIQVHCKNHNCPNSKEQGGWFTPTYNQLYERHRALVNPSSEYNENNFYCSDECKRKCILYKTKSDPLNKIKKELPYTYAQYNEFREFVLERDNYICQYCGKKAEHVHHIKPQKLEPFFSLDPDYSISVCKDCHYKYCHKDECSLVNISLSCRGNK